MSITIEAVTESTAHLHTSVPTRVLLPLLRRLDIPRQFNHDLRLWMVPRSRISDLVDACHESGRPVCVFGAYA